MTGPVIDMALHPSGRMLLALYKGIGIKLWDLTEGKSVYGSKVQNTVFSLKWNNTGDLYALQSDTSISIYSIESDEPINTIELDK